MALPVETKETETKSTRTKVLAGALTAFHVLVVLFGFLIFIAAYWLGILFNVFYVLLPVLVLGMAFSRIMGAAFNTLELRFIRKPLDATFRKFQLQCINQWIFLILTLFALRLALIPVQFAPAQYRLMLWLAWGAVAILIALGLLPQRKVRFTTNSFFLVGSLFLGTELVRIFVPPAQSVALASPFDCESYIFNGGRSTLINHHYPLLAQRHALDITVTKDGREVSGNNSKLESYPAWGKTILAPAAGEVVAVVNDRPDMQIDETDSKQILGNHIVMDIGQGRFVLMAHLKKGSARVLVGDEVTQGEPVAECGNSGNTSAPHLHLQVQSHADFQAHDLHTFPILFKDVTRVRSGRRERMKEADPRRNDRLIPSLLSNSGK